MHAGLAGHIAAIGAAEHAHCEFRAPGPHQPGDADNLALAHMQADALDDLAPGMLRMLDAPVVYLEQARADVRLAMRIAVGHFAPHHALDDAALADFLGVAVDGLDRRAVAQHGDRVGDFRQLVKLVRDHDRGDALRLELQQQVQQRVAVALVEARRRLVEDKQLDLLGERLGDLDELLLAHAKVGDQRLRRFPQADFLQQRTRSRKRLVPVEDAEPRRLVAEKHVLGDRQQRHQRQLLVDDDDAEMFAVGNAREAPLGAVVDNFALVGAVRIDAAQHLHQG